uniref:Uncharacterized protein n=1 Tax=Geobacillus stearothermophilus TaxID=1422 RepID=Q9APD7_GEOSE|nr:unknown [Geobacillus stearothermophilus]
MNLDDYLDLMPRDVREEYLAVKNEYGMKFSKNDHKIDIEGYIVKSIYNVIKARESNKKSLKQTSETKLSDDLRDILNQELRNCDLIIERETSRGFAKKQVGEVDLFNIYKNGIIRNITIGKNNEFGDYERQIKQLIGYMEKEMTFGFAIILNKKKI